MIFNEFYRLCSIIRTILQYGLIDYIPKNKLIYPLKIGRNFLLKNFNKYSQFSLEKRFRLALEKLGPIWIKFGQMLSTRHDIFSSSTIKELALLQDQVKPFDGLIARKHIEFAIGKPVEFWFENFQEKPLASASISQVHCAKFKKNNKNVVIKIIRPGIVPIIQADICLMYRLEKFFSKILIDWKKNKFSNIISEYKKNIFYELNLLRETANTIQLKRNFQKSNLLYIPKVYVDLCNKNIMVMERIYDIPVYNIKKIKKTGINMKLLAERGIEIFFTQVFRDNFFHGDMHPGNIFINCINPKNPKYIFIDCGIVGSLNKKDKYYLALNFIALFNRNYRKIAELHLDSGWIPKNTKIEDFEYSIRTIFEPIFEKPLKDIPCSHILLYLFNTIQKFHMEVQPQLILLQKSLLYIEGIIRKIYPSLNLWQSSKPFLEKWIQNQLKISKTICILKEKTPFWIEKIPELPELLYYEFKNTYFLKNNLYELIKISNIKQTKCKKSLFLFGIGSVFFICSILLFMQNVYTYIFSLILLFFGIIFWIIGWKKIT